MGYKAVIFDDFASSCPYAYAFADGNINNGYNCSHPEQEEVGYCRKNEKEVGCCYCWSCPLGIAAEEEDFKNDNIDWDGLCESEDEIEEGEYLLISIDDSATDDRKKALDKYECHMNRYNEKWMEEHEKGIQNIHQFLEAFACCFNDQMQVKACGREKTKHLIYAAQNVQQNTDFGSTETGMMNIDAILCLYGTTKWASE